MVLSVPQTLYVPALSWALRFSARSRDVVVASVYWISNSFGFLPMSSSAARTLRNSSFHSVRTCS
jgi:hypothetical protein